MRFHVAIDVMPKEGISDPQGQTIERSLPGLGFTNIEGVRVGKRMTMTVDAGDEAEARSALGSACKKFLTNPVIEDFVISVLDPQEVK